jgi:hypothetical protein
MAKIQQAPAQLNLIYLPPVHPEHFPAKIISTLPLEPVPSSLSVQVHRYEQLFLKTKAFSLGIYSMDTRSRGTLRSKSSVMLDLP